MTNKERAIGASPYEVEQFFTGHGRGHTVGKQAAQIGFKRLSPDAVLPTRAHPTDSGFDLCASEDVIISPGATVVIPTGIAVKLPPGYEATVRPRSGVTSRTKLRVQLGTIDGGYGGEIGVIVDNISQKGPLGPNFVRIDEDSDKPHAVYRISKGERIAQLVITRLPAVEAVEIAEIGESERGANGFGSTGVR